MTTATKDTEKAQLERERERARITRAFQRLFASEDGKTVLAYIKSYFRADNPAFDRPPMGQHYDPIAAALRDGSREVILFIERKIAEPVKADGDIKKPKTKTIRP